MKDHEKSPKWCDLPYREFERELSDLDVIGARCDAWRAFFQSDTLKRLRRLKGHCLWFNQYQMFEKLIIEFACGERALRRAIDGLVRPESFPVVYDFQRTDIYDARAWAWLPLSWFVECESPESPVVQVGLRLPWTITKDCFSMRSKLRAGGRDATMTFSHPNIDSRFKGKRWVAYGRFPVEATRQQMWDSLWAEVVAKCAKHLVLITD